MKINYSLTCLATISLFALSTQALADTTIHQNIFVTSQPQMNNVQRVLNLGFMKKGSCQVDHALYFGNKNYINGEVQPLTDAFLLEVSGLVRWTCAQDIYTYTTANNQTKQMTVSYKIIVDPTNNRYQSSNPFASVVNLQ